MPNYPDSIQDLEPLSGLYIRKRFLNEVRTFLDQKHPQGWCIVAIDIENFKLFNDWYGRTAVIICFWKLLPIFETFTRKITTSPDTLVPMTFLSACQMTVTNSATFMQQFIITLINWNKMIVFFHPSASIGLKTNL